MTRETAFEEYLEPDLEKSGQRKVLQKSHREMQFHNWLGQGIAKSWLEAEKLWQARSGDKKG